METSKQEATELAKPGRGSVKLRSMTMLFCVLGFVQPAQPSDEDEDPDRTDHVVREFEWTSSSGNTYKLGAELSLSEFTEDKNFLCAPNDIKFRESIRYFQTGGWIEAFEEMSEDYNEPLHELAASWVQSIPYKSSNDPALLPSMTLLYGQGDCDDKSLLAAGLLASLGFDVALWNIPGSSHMGIGIVLEETSGTFVEHKGREYTWWEMTSPYDPGEYGDDLAQSVKLIFPASEKKKWKPCK